MDGYELARHLRAQPNTARTRLVAVTGYGQKNDIDTALKVGFDEHVGRQVKMDKVVSI
jgi:CheY-like chemotaxis protein